MVNQKKSKLFNTHLSALSLAVIVLVWSVLIIASAANAGPKTFTPSGTPSGTLVEQDSTALLTYTSSAVLSAGDGIRVNTDSYGASVTLDAANDKLTITATPSIHTDAEKNSCGTVTKAEEFAGNTTVTLTVKNPSTLPVKVTGLTYANATLDAEHAADLQTNGYFVLAPNDTFTLTVVTAQESNNPSNEGKTVTATVSATAETMSTNTLTLVAPYGGYTVTVDDGSDTPISMTVAAGQTVVSDPAIIAGSTVTLPTAAAVENYIFYGWQLSDGQMLASGKTFALSNDITVAPVYLPSSKFATNADGKLTYTNSAGATSLGPFSVSGTRYMFWREAVNAAKTSGAPIILAEDFTLPTKLEENGIYLTSNTNVSGTDGNLTYTIPTGITFLIPYDFDEAANTYTLCTTAPTISQASYSNPSAAANVAKHRTLTMPTGTHIVTNGALSLSAQQCAKMGYNGFPTGVVSFIKMAETSSITVDNGGALYAWGYVTGSGSVLVKDRSFVYECFQLTDWRGGNASSGMKGSNNPDVFPFSQYYVQNVEVPMTLEDGATEYGYMSVSFNVPLSGTTYAGNAVPFVGSSGMFRLSNGTLTKDYDETTDRIIVTVDGDGRMCPIALSIEHLITININSGDFVMPVTNHLTVNLSKNSSLSLEQDMSFLPGSQMNIEEGATVSLLKDMNMFVYDRDEWITSETTDSAGVVTATGYVGASNKAFVPLTYVPGRPSTVARTSADLVDAEIIVNGTLDTSAGNLYTTTGGAMIRSEKSTGLVKLSGAADRTTNQAHQTSNEIDSYPSIAVTSAQLKNGDIWAETTPYTTTSGTAGSYYYHADHKMWVKDGHASTGTQKTVEATCITDGAVYDVCTCSFETLVDELPLLGHEEQTTIPAAGATCTTGGVKAEIVCTRCGETVQEAVSDGTNPTGHKWLNGECSNGCGAQFKISSVSLAVNDGLDLYFYVNPSDIYNGSYTAQIHKDYADGRTGEGEMSITSDLWMPNQGKIRFGYNDISAKEMNDKVYVTIFNADGTQASYPFAITVKEYAMGLLAKDDIKNAAADSRNAYLRTALVDMLIYGAECQNQFKYGQDVYATSDLSEAQLAYATSDDTAKAISGTGYVAGDYLYAVSFSAKNNLMYTFYYDLDADSTTGDTAVDLENTIATVTFTDHYGEARTITTSDWFARRIGSKVVYGVDIPGIPIASGRSLLTCTISGGITSTSSDSVECFTARTANNSQTQKTMNMLMRFVDSAAAYFTASN